MSHDGSWRAACNTTNRFLPFHFGDQSVARGVTDPSVGSGALFGRAGTWMTGLKKNEIRAEDSGIARLELTDAGVRQRNPARYTL
jgi:hypothetical protein